jgi:hypothetical protein
MTPGTEPILTLIEGFYMNKLVRHPLEEISYQKSKLKLFQIFTRRFFRIFGKIIFRLPWQPGFFMEFHSYSNFGRASCKEHPCNLVSTNLTKWFKRGSCLKKLLMHGRWTMGHHISSPRGHCPQVS